MPGGGIAGILSERDLVRAMHRIGKACSTSAWAT